MRYPVSRNKSSAERLIYEITPLVQSQSLKSKYYSAKPIADWLDRNAKAPGMVRALMPLTPKICN